MTLIKILFLLINTFIFLNANDIRSTYEQSAIKIINALENDSIGYNRLSYLCDMFGPRLSGSKNLEKSIDWVIKEMKNDGLSNVKGERVKVPTWIRGEESLKILIPFFLYSDVFPKDVNPFKPLPLKSLIKKFSYKSSI